MIDVCHEEKVQIIETSGRSPEPYMKHIKDGKTIHMHKCTRVRDAMKTEALGADLVTIMGIEGGGHPGYEEVTTLVLLPRTVDAVRIPVLAGGGFADGRGLMAALALGAGGIVLGTRLLATEECPIHPAFKKAVLDAEVNSTTLLLRSIKDHRRVLLNYRAQEILEMEARGGALEEILKKMAGQRIKEAYETGDTQGEIFPCGQVAGLIKEILPVRELFQKILHEAEEIHRGRSI
jgi:nitronate monooxygenase